MDGNNIPGNRGSNKNEDMSSCKNEDMSSCKIDKGDDNIGYGIDIRETPELLAPHPDQLPLALISSSLHFLIPG